ncbi:MAG: hypothetical protein LBS74_04425 [Oscillospiraceae bacterium]|jgi:ABC-type antimicrobial peptide transport system permease subunit|nr:hypothetical protein [Oscillospiraceae bacterium]
MIHFLKIYILKTKFLGKGILPLMLFFFISFSIALCALTISQSATKVISQDFESEEALSLTVDNPFAQKTEAECLREFLQLEGIEKAALLDGKRYSVKIIDYKHRNEVITTLSQKGYKVLINNQLQMDIDTTESLSSMMKAITVAVVVIVFIILLLFLIKSINEQINEIALFKALGYQGFQISMLVSVEFFIALITGAILSALFCGFAVLPIIKSTVSEGLAPTFEISLCFEIFAAFILLIVLAIFSQIKRINKVPVSLLLKE